MLKRMILTVFFGIAAASSCFPSDVKDENEMFSSPDVLTQPSNNAKPAEEKKSISFSGRITSVTEDVGVSTSTMDGLYSYIVSNALIDVRMKNDIKAFADVETSYFAQSRTTTYDVRELFFDFNLDRKVYFRTGKQVLQWGRCYLWNPTDLINIEKLPFIRKIGNREGAYGMKFHVPFGAKENIYGFLDTGNASSSDALGGALKYEFLTGRTEMAFSGWAKKGYNPMFGYDFSTRAGYVDILGEFSISRGDNLKRIRVDQGALDVYTNNYDWAPRTSINFSKGFRLGNFNDRLTVSTEFFYNQLGYDEDLFKDQAVYQFGAPLLLPNGTAVNAGTKRDFLLGNNLYTPNYLSRYYGAVFTTITRFLITDMSFNCNYIRNFNDGSGILSAGVTYANIYDFSAGLLLNSFLGPENGEYTFLGIKYDAQLTFGISF